MSTLHSAKYAREPGVHGKCFSLPISSQTRTASCSIQANIDLHILSLLTLSHSLSSLSLFQTQCPPRPTLTNATNPILWLLPTLIWNNGSEKEAEGWNAWHRPRQISCVGYNHSRTLGEDGFALSTEWRLYTCRPKVHLLPNVQIRLLFTTKVQTSGLCCKECPPSPVY